MLHIQTHEQSANGERQDVNRQLSAAIWTLPAKSNKSVWWMLLFVSFFKS